MAKFRISGTCRIPDIRPDIRQPVYQIRIRTGYQKMPISGAGYPAHRISGTTLDHCYYLSVVNISVVERHILYVVDTFR